MELVQRTQSAPPSSGLSGFPSLLVDRGRLSRSDLLIAQQHAQREHMELADALIALGLLSRVNGVFRRLKVMAA